MSSAAIVAWHARQRRRKRREAGETRNVTVLPEAPLVVQRPVEKPAPAATVTQIIVEEGARRLAGTLLPSPLERPSPPDDARVVHCQVQLLQEPCRLGAQVHVRISVKDLDTQPIHGAYQLQVHMHFHDHDVQPLRADIEYDELHTFEQRHDDVVFLATPATAVPMYLQLRLMPWPPRRGRSAGGLTVVPDRFFFKPCTFESARSLEAAKQ